MKKKILAGVLAGVTALSTSVSAFATSAPTEKDLTKVEKAGETKYSVAVGTLDVKLNVTIPKKMSAFLNPYNASVKVDAEATPTTANDGVVSWNYEIVNRTEDFGVNVDIVGANAKVSKNMSMATAADLPATAGDAMVGTATDKKVFLALLASDKDGNFLTVDQSLVNTKHNDSTSAVAGAGAYIFKTVDAKEGETLTKFAYVPAGTEAAPSTVKLAFRGNLSTVDADGNDLTWGSTEKVTASFSFKLAPSGGATGGGSSFTAAVDKSMVTWGSDFVVGNLVANDTYEATWDATSGNITPTFDSSLTLDDATSSDTSKATVRTSDGRLTPQGDGETTITYTFDDGTSIKFKVTISNS